MINTRISVLTFLAYLIVARLSCPALSNIPFMSMGFIFVYGLAFAFLLFLSLRKISKCDLFLLFSIVCYIVYVLVQLLLGGGSLFDTDAFRMYVVVFLTLIYIWIKTQPLYVKKNVIMIILISSIFNYVYSIIVLFFDPNASRTSAATSVLEASPYDVLHAVGSFDAVNGAIFVIIILLYMRSQLAKNCSKTKSLLAIIIFLASVFILMAAYATAIVLFALALCIHISRKNRALSVIGICAVALIFIFHEQFGQFIMDASKSITYSDVVSEKLGEFGSMIKDLEATGTYEGEGGRAERMMWSLESFYKYPIFGGYVQPDGRSGSHSELFDILGKYGLVGFGLITAYMCLLYTSIKSELKNNGSKRALNIVYIVFVIAAILNPSFYTLQMLPIILMIYLGERFTDYYELKGQRRSTN